MFLILIYRKERGNVWPPNWQEESSAFKAAMEEREKELGKLTGGLERWENYMQYTQSRMVPHFTEKGFDVIDIPKNVYQKLLDAVLPKLDNFESLPEEQDVEAIYNKYACFNFSADSAEIFIKFQTNIKPNYY